MEVFLTKQCLSLTGCLGRGYGYYLRSTKKGRFYSQRSKHSVPPDGHWRFIVICAELAQNKLHITDIKVGWLELKVALMEACLYPSAQMVDVGKIYNAQDILTFKERINL